MPVLQSSRILAPVSHACLYNYKLDNLLFLKKSQSQVLSKLVSPSFTLTEWVS